MANIAIAPVMVVTTTGAGTTTITTDLTPATGERILADTVELEFGTAAADNTVDIQFGEDGSGHANIIPQFVNFSFLRIHLSDYFPRAVEFEETDDFRIVHTRGTSSTCVSRVFYIKRAE